MSRPIIAVFGATRAQGGGLVRALLDDPGRHLTVRAVTRKPDGAAARATLRTWLAANKSRIPVAKAA
jgi:uncharacterized protein YbjT (DUF2867 family)